MNGKIGDLNVGVLSPVQPLGPEVIDVVAGARPNFMKIAPIVRELAPYAGVVASKLVHTGQHYDYELSTAFFEAFSLGEPDTFLGVGGKSRAPPPPSRAIA